MTIRPLIIIIIIIITLIIRNLYRAIIPLGDYRGRYKLYTEQDSKDPTSGINNCP